MSYKPSPPASASVESDIYRDAVTSSPRTHASQLEIEESHDEQEMPTPNFKFERVMGSNELSYYLPSRADGANDSSLQFKFECVSNFVTPRRINIVWAILRLLHPLYSSSIEMEPGEYDRARFVYTAPSSPAAAIVEARHHYQIFANKTAEQLVDMFSNGPRLLSKDGLCRLLITIPPSTPHPSVRHKVHDALFWYSHQSNDGVSAHGFASEFFSLLGGHSPSSPSVPRSEEELESMLQEQWEKRWGKRYGAVYSPGGFRPIPCAAEGRMSSYSGKFKGAVERVAFQNSMEKDVGAHVFPRVRPTYPGRQSKIKTFVIPPHYSRSILALCKSRDVTLTNSIFVLVAFAWLRLVASRTDPRNIRVTEAERKLWRAHGNEQMPIMMYTAVNPRPYMDERLAPLESYIFVALGYLNIVLPGFLPRLALEGCSTEEERRKMLERTFWLRVRSVRDQYRRFLRSPLFASHNREMARERACKAKAWAVIDDREEETRRRKRKGLPPLPSPHFPPAQQAASAQTEKSKQKQPKLPSAALLGLSLFANLDSVYLPTNFPALDIVDHHEGTRKNTGSMLLMGYTFRGKIYSTLGWDARCFEPGVVEEFWEIFEETLKEFLVPGVQNVVFERGLECDKREVVEARL